MLAKTRIKGIFLSITKLLIRVVYFQGLAFEAIPKKTFSLVRAHILPN
jgi:hypothetical protein